MEDNLNKSLIASVASDLTPVTVDLREVVFDSLLKDGFLKDIPFGNTIISLIKAGANIRERIFAKKLFKFLFELKSIPQLERIQFAERLEDDEETRNSVGEKVLTILDKLDDTGKASMVGKLFRAFIHQYFDYTTFLRLSYIVNRSFTSDLNSLGSCFSLDKHTYNLPLQLGSKLHSIGLAEIKIVYDTHANTLFETTTGRKRDELAYRFEYELNHDAYAIVKELYNIVWIKYGEDAYPRYKNQI